MLRSAEACKYATGEWRRYIHFNTVYSMIEILSYKVHQRIQWGIVHVWFVSVQSSYFLTLNMKDISIASQTSPVYFLLHEKVKRKPYRKVDSIHVESQCTTVSAWMATHKLRSFKGFESVADWHLRMNNTSWHTDFVTLYRLARQHKWESRLLLLLRILNIRVHNLMIVSEVLFSINSKFFKYGIPTYSYCVTSLPCSQKAAKKWSRRWDSWVFQNPSFSHALSCYFRFSQWNHLAVNSWLYIFDLFSWNYIFIFKHLFIYFSLHFQIVKLRLELANCYIFYSIFVSHFLLYWYQS